MDRFEPYLDGDATAQAGLAVLKSIVPDLSSDKLAKLTGPGVAEALEAFRRFQLVETDGAPRQKRPSTAGARSSISGASGRRLSQNAGGTQPARRSSQIAAGDGETDRPQTANADIRNARNSTVARNPESNHLKQVFSSGDAVAPVKFERNLSKKFSIETNKPSASQPLERRGSAAKEAEEKPKKDDKRQSIMNVEPSVYRSLLGKEIEASNKLAAREGYSKPSQLSKSKSAFVMSSTPEFDPSASAKPTMPPKDSKRQSVLDVHKEKLDAANAPSKFRGLVG
jgi:hypothetical protein